MATCSNCGYRTSIEIPPIPVLNLLGSSRIPSPSKSEARLIQDTVHRLHDDLRRLNDEVSRVQTLLHNLMRNRDALSTHYRSQKALLAPIRRIPPEILSEIFMSSLTFHLKSSAAFPRRKDVLLPGQICRHWRDIAISTPRLWSALKFDLRVYYEGRELQMARTWLARSGSVALTLALDTYEETPQTHPITNVVLAYAPRIYCMILEAPLAILRSLQSAMGQMPCLQRLIITRPFGDLARIPQSLYTFKIAPKLRYLELRRMVSVQIPNIPWAQLLELQLFGYEYTLNDFFQILRNSPNLARASCHFLSSVYSQLPHGAIVHHSNLSQLDVNLEDLGPLFNSLSLPALTSLSCGSLPQDEFISFLRRSSFSLQRLVLKASDNLNEDYIDDVLECLRHTPNLLELELLCCSGEVDNSFWNGMSVNHHNSLPCLVPKLRRIQVTRSCEFDYTAFVDMVESRWRLKSVPSTVHATAVERIQSVEVSLIPDHEHYDMYDECVDPGGEYFVRLRQFRAEGLEVIAPDMDTAQHSSSSASSFDEDAGQDDSPH